MVLSVSQCFPFFSLLLHLQELKSQASLLAQQNENLKESQKGTDTLHTQLATADREARALKIQVQELMSAQESHFGKIRELNGTIVRLESDKIHSDRDLELLRQELDSLREQVVKPRAAEQLAMDHVRATKRIIIIIASHGTPNCRLTICPCLNRLFFFF